MCFHEKKNLFKMISYLLHERATDEFLQNFTSHPGLKILLTLKLFHAENSFYETRKPLSRNM